eukprot:751345-Hanusia_phi.AAC.4
MAAKSADAAENTNCSSQVRSPRLWMAFRADDAGKGNVSDVSSVDARGTVALREEMWSLFPTSQGRQPLAEWRVAYKAVNFPFEEGTVRPGRGARGGKMRREDGDECEGGEGAGKRRGGVMESESEWARSREGREGEGDELKLLTRRQAPLLDTLLFLGPFPLAIGRVLACCRHA